MPQIIDPQLIRARLETDRAWTAFALADLDPHYAPFATWFGPTDSRQTLGLVYSAFARPLVVYSGPVADGAAVFEEMDMAMGLSADAHIVVKPELLPTVVVRYHSYEARPMLRMVLDLARPRALARETQVVRLGPDDLESVQALYAEAPPEFFVPAQLGQGCYYGVREGGAIIAIAGTHVVSPQSRVAALGNVHTRSDRRGRGLATAVTSAVTRELIRAGATTIVLNVRDDNDQARRVYERLGYAEYCRYYEGIATRSLTR